MAQIPTAHPATAPGCFAADISVAPVPNGWRLQQATGMDGRDPADQLCQTASARMSRESAQVCQRASIKGLFSNDQTANHERLRPANPAIGRTSRGRVETGSELRRRHRAINKHRGSADINARRKVTVAGLRRIWLEQPAKPSVLLRQRRCGSIWAQTDCRRYNGGGQPNAAGRETTL